MTPNPSMIAIDDGPDSVGRCRLSYGPPRRAMSLHRSLISAWGLGGARFKVCELPNADSVHASFGDGKDTIHVPAKIIEAIPAGVIGIDFEVRVRFHSASERTANALQNLMDDGVEETLIDLRRRLVDIDG